MKFRRLYIFLVLSLLGAAIYAQTVKLDAPSRCTVGEKIQVVYTIEVSSVEDISLGDFPGFDIIYGPSVSSSSEYSYINGRATQREVTYVSITLVARQTGKFHIPAITIRTKGKNCRSKSAEVTVTQGSGNTGPGNSPSASQPSAPSRAASSGHISKDDLFITAEVNKRNVYEQEAIVLTYKIYSAVHLRNITGKMPEMDGFHCQELENKPQLSLSAETYNGRRYLTAVWRKYILIPQKSGHLHIPSVNFDAECETINPSMDLIDEFFNGGGLAHVVVKTIATPALNIDVKSLPTPKPDDFSGAVGHYTISSSLSPTDIKANDASTYRLVVSGSGNMKLISAPKSKFPADFEAYDPKIDDQTHISAKGNEGNIAFDYIIVPRHEGKYEIQPMHFVYFDPEAGRYVTLKTDKYTMNVAKGSGTHRNTSSQEDLKVLSNDIRYIMTGDADISENKDDYFGTLSYILSYIGILALFGIVFAILRRRAQLNANVARQRGRRASRAAQKRLKQASVLLARNDANAFYDEVLRALLGYAGDKLNISTQDLNKENVAVSFRQRGVGEELVTRFIDVLTQCEFARFAPGDPGETMDTIYHSAIEAINEMENVI